MVRKIPTFSELILSFHTKVLTIGNFPTSQQFMKMAPSFSRGIKIKDFNEVIAFLLVCKE